MRKKFQFQYVMEIPDGMSLVGALPVYPQRTPATEKLRIRINTPRDNLKLAVIGLVIITIMCVCTVAYQYHVNKIERIQSRSHLQVSSLKPITHAPVANSTPVQRESPLVIAKEVPLALELAEQPTLPVVSSPITGKKALAKNEAKSKVEIPKLVLSNKKFDGALITPSETETLPQFIIADSKKSTTKQKTSIFKRPLEVDSKPTEIKPNTESTSPQKLF